MGHIQQQPVQQQPTLTALPTKSIDLATASYDNHEHIIVDINLQIDNKSIRTFAMIDSGSMANFIDKSFSEKNNLTTCSKEKAINVITVDGSPINSGPVDKEIHTKLFIGVHEEEITLDITKLGQYPIILGIPWLRHHNPNIKWSDHSITFDSDYCAHHCFNQAQCVKTLDSHPNISTSINKNEIINEPHFNMPPIPMLILNLCPMLLSRKTFLKIIPVISMRPK